MITHVVGFKYKPTITQAEKEEVLSRFLALKQACKRDGNSYIESLVGGDCTGSLERLTRGFEQVFVATFSNVDDFNYYLGQPFSASFDPAHDEFKNFVFPLLSVDENGQTNGVVVLDFPNPS